MYHSHEKQVLNMIKYQVLLVILVEVISYSTAWNVCIPLRDCPVALKYLEKRRNDPETINILRKNHCGTNREAKVYCNRIPDFEEDIKIKTKQVKPVLEIGMMMDECGGHDSKLDLLPKKTECGLLSLTTKITNGEVAEFEDFPWLALLSYKDSSGKVTHRCHGTLISKRYVVTAAHCLQYSSAQRRKTGSLSKIVLGEYDTSQVEDCHRTKYGPYCTDPIQEFSPESIHVHPSFEPSEAKTDIALVRLNRDATYSDYVKPICLPIDPINLRPGEVLQIAGWGRTEQNKASNVKLKARINLLPNARCARFGVDSTQICAGSTTGADTCKGDSGGPLVASRQSVEDRETRDILIGVVSFGDKCGSGYAVYSNVTMFVNWILNTIH